MWQFDRISNTFIPGTLPADGSKITACYDRLSQEDAQEGDSVSIQNQRDFLRRYCEEHHFLNVRHFSDDGYTGTNFDRPGFQEMMDLIEQGRVSAVIVKDHSRLGRNRLVVGTLMERFTEDYGVRYIAVTDGIDSSKGFDDLVAIREWFNEFYPRDTSKKIRAVFTNKGNNGQRLCTQVPYGYKGNKYGWEIDEEAASVVREIFSLCIAGKGPMQIAKYLTAQQVLTPTVYKLEHGFSTANKPRANPYAWDSTLVVKILERMEYTGCTVNFKTRKKSYKSKKTLYLPLEERKIFPDTHPAIIDRETWERVQELRKNKRRPAKHAERQGLFSGLLFCADCGSKLHFATGKGMTPAQDCYRCSRYKSNTGDCTMHYIREVVLRDLVLEHLRQTIAFVSAYEDEFIRLVMDKTTEDQRKAAIQKQRELAQVERRIKELDKLFQHIYEDNVSGKLTNERFSKMSAAYEEEQQTLTARTKVLRTELNREQEQAGNVAQFLALVKRHTDMQELTPSIVNEFIERITVSAPDKSSGHRVQKIHIKYNFVGVLPDITTQSKTA